MAEYSARINAHHPRRLAFPKLADNYLKHTCLDCFTKMDVFVEGSEWHNFFYCPCTVRPRELFLHACPSFYSIFFPESPPPGMVVSMAKIFHEARFNRYLTNELARFVAGIHTCRREAFASLSKRGPLNPLRVALERVVLPDQSD